MSDTLNYIFNADEFLRGSGYLGTFQKNTLILNTLVLCDKAKNVSFDIDTNKQTINVVLYFKRWKMLFLNRNKIIQRLSSFYKDYLPSYSFKINFDIWQKNKKT